MKKLFIYSILLICIPFLLVNFIKVHSNCGVLEEIDLNYLSNVIFRVKREDGNIIMFF